MLCVFCISVTLESFLWQVTQTYRNQSNIQAEIQCISGLYVHSNSMKVVSRYIYFNPVKYMQDKLYINIRKVCNISTCNTGA